MPARTQAQGREVLKIVARQATPAHKQIVRTLLGADRCRLLTSCEAPEISCIDIVGANLDGDASVTFKPIGRTGQPLPDLTYEFSELGEQTAVFILHALRSLLEAGGWVWNDERAGIWWWSAKRPG